MAHAEYPPLTNSHQIGQEQEYRPQPGLYAAQGQPAAPSRFILGHDDQEHLVLADINEILHHSKCVATMIFSTATHSADTLFREFCVSVVAAIFSI